MGWVPPYLCPSGACLGSRHEGLLQPLNVQRGLRHTGAAALPMLRAWGKVFTAIRGQAGPGTASEAISTLRMMAQTKAAISRAIATTTWVMS